MKLISTAVALVATTHISFFALADQKFRERVATDPLFSIMAYQMGYYSPVMCSPNQSEDLPHSPYHHGGAVACHGFTCPGTVRLKKDGLGEVLCDDGTPATGSINAARKTVDWNDGWLERLQDARTRLQQRRIERRLSRA